MCVCVSSKILASQSENEHQMNLDSSLQKQVAKHQVNRFPAAMACIVPIFSLAIFEILSSSLRISFEEKNWRKKNTFNCNV